MKKILIGLAALLAIAAVVATSLYLPHYLQVKEWERTAILGGPLRPLMAAYDVRRYDLGIEVFPETESIRGSNTVTVEILSPLEQFEIHLDNRLTVDAVIVDGKTGLPFRHADGRISIDLESAWAAGERHLVQIDYHGKPMVAPTPPWKDGFVWSESESGSPWFGTTSQGSGGDLWWPVKDHPSDEPEEGMGIVLSVPEGLVGLANGRKLGESVIEGRSVSSWEVTYPINTYAVAINGGPFVPIEATYTSITDGREIPILFWALPEHEEQAREMWLDQGPKILTVFGKAFGEYPFLDDKYWVVETPYLGMEHQTIVAYGSNFKINDYGFDWLLLHETAHEWFANKITASDWSDYWIHEGFGAYAHAVFVYDTLGEEKYLEYMQNSCGKPDYRNPVIKGSNLVGEDAYVGEVYSKASCVLHSLRWLLGEADFRSALYRFLNDDAFAYQVVDTDGFRGLVAEITGENHDWFFDTYLYDTKIPQLIEQRSEDGTQLSLRWDIEDFELPVPVEINGDIVRVTMPDGEADITLPADATVVIDPQGWLLRKK